ncbi:MAG: hypothetical protein QNJ51_21610 [Calothrix sp. MO_167.B12]|nr:hypothetical protein [Calothrix sp. MO_167.B12]
MPFQKNHKLGALPYGDEPLDTKPVSFKPRRGQLEKLKAIPNWQERLRDYIDTLIKEEYSD